MSLGVLELIGPIPLLGLAGIATFVLVVWTLGRQNLDYVKVTTTNLIYHQARTITVPLASIISIDAVSVDLATHESWGLQLHTNTEGHYIDEDLKGFEKAAYRLGKHFGFDANEAIASANASLIKQPFDGFRRTLWMASAN